MNLMEVQDNLNKLPPVPASVQYLTAAAQGGNPQVPPFMALARISEINKQMQSAQNKPQPPAEPLNQSLPKQALQSMGIGALPQGAPQGMPQGAQPAAAPAPQGAPQMPPQQAPQTVMAAGGGLMSLPVDDNMFEYGSGGVVAFANPEGDQLVEDEDENADEEESDVEAGTPSTAPRYDAVAELRRLQPQIDAQMKQGVRTVRSRPEIEAELIKKKDYGVDQGPIGTKYLEGLASLKEAKAADRAQQQADIDKRKQLAASRGLLKYSDASRGQTGLGGIGALGEHYISSTEKFMEEETGLRQAGIKVEEMLNDAQYKVQALRQAQRDGDVKAEQKADVDLAKLAKDLGVSKNRLLQAAVTGNLGVIGKQIMADAQVQSARERAKGKGAGAAKKPTDLGSSYEIELAALLEAGEPNDALTRKKAMNSAQAQLSKSAGTERNRITSVKEANTEFANRILMDREARKLRSKPDEYKARAEAIRREVETEFGIKPDAAVPPAPAPVPAQAPAAGGSVLPPGTTLGKVVPGKGTEVLKNGKLIGYAN
jgi:hypothetical protein